MAEIIRMPEVLAGATEAAVSTWLVQAGATVTVGANLAEIETDKAIVELASESAGTIGRLLVAEGTTVSVGEPIIVLVADGEDDAAVDAALSAAGVAAEPAPAPASSPSPAAPTAVPAAPEPETAPESETASQPETAPESEPAAASDASSAPRPEGSRLFASPIVRRLARQHGVDVALVEGSGPDGRIVRRDLERYLASAPAAAPTASTAPTASEAAPAPAAPAGSSAPTPSSPTAGAAYEDVPLDRMRRAIARRLTESKSTVPHFYLVADCRVDALLELRRQVNAAGTRKISVNDFVLKAVASALVDVPTANAIWNGDSIRRFSGVDISVAVATEGGLTTPVLRGVERMPLSEISATVADLAERGRAGRLRQHELDGGSFSVSNLGMYGTSEFSAILNPPQSGILAVGAARPQPVVDADGQLAVGTVMTVTLSADHRVLDGAVAAQWLAAFQKRVENPLTILI